MAGKDHTTRLDKGLYALMRSLDTSGALSTAAIIEVWDTVVGPEIAAHTFISGIKNNELVVLVDSPVWAMELTAMAEQLRTRLQEESGQESVTHIRFTVSRRVGVERKERLERTEAERGYGGDRLEPVALTEQELEVVKRSVAAIENTELREAALRATIADLEWKKAQEQANSAQASSESLYKARKPL